MNLTVLHRTMNQIETLTGCYTESDVGLLSKDGTGKGIGHMVLFPGNKSTSVSL